MMPAAGDVAMSTQEQTERKINWIVKTETERLKLWSLIDTLLEYVSKSYIRNS